MTKTIKFVLFILLTYGVPGLLVIAIHLALNLGPTLFVQHLISMWLLVTAIWWSLIAWFLLETMDVD